MRWPGPECERCGCSARWLASRCDGHRPARAGSALGAADHLQAPCTQPGPCLSAAAAASREAALGFAVGLGPVGAGAQVGDAAPGRQLGQEPRAEVGAVVGHHRVDGHVINPEHVVGPPPEPGGGGGLVVEGLNVGDPGVVVHGRVQAGVPAAAAAAPAAAGLGGFGGRGLSSRPRAGFSRLSCRRGVPALPLFPGVGIKGELGPVRRIVWGCSQRGSPAPRRPGRRQQRRPCMSSGAVSGVRDRFMSCIPHSLLIQVKRPDRRKPRPTTVTLRT